MMIWRTLFCCCIILYCSAAIAGQPCQYKYTSSAPVPAGWGAGYDVLNPLNTTPLTWVSVDCTTTPVTIITAGDGSADQWVYSAVYTTQAVDTETNPGAATWTAHSLTCSAVGGWCPRQGTADLGLSSVDLANWTYIAFVVAKWDGVRWRIGCADLACATSNWNLQAVMVPPVAAPTLAVSTSPADVAHVVDQVAIGAVVAVITVTWSNGAPFTGTLGFASPNFDDGGNFAIVGSNLIVNKDLSGLSGSSRQVTIIATQ